MANAQLMQPLDNSLTESQCKVCCQSWGQLGTEEREQCGEKDQ